MAAFTIDPDIRRATTLPSAVYHDESFFRAAREKVFARSWQLLGDAERMKEPGHVLPCALLEGMLDEPLVLTRDAKDELHCLSNVCTHRANVLVHGEGNVPQLRCRYHGRRFGLDGRFVSMPEFEGAEGFPRAEDSLPRVPLARFGRFLFASLAPAFPWSAFDDVLARLSWLPFDQFVRDDARARQYLVQANWALYCDNYLEGFHIPYVHAGLARAIDYGSYRTELSRYANVQIAMAAEGESAFDLPETSPDHGARIAAYYVWLFPNTMLNFYPWGLSINVVTPLAADRTRVLFLPYVWDESKLAHGAGAGLDRVEREDEVVVEAVQRGVRARLYPGGRYSPTREVGVHHFHRLLAEFLA